MKKHNQSTKKVLNDRVPISLNNQEHSHRQHHLPPEVTEEAMQVVECMARIIYRILNEESHT